MVPEFLEGRSMNASAHVYHVTLCISVRPLECVCVFSYSYSFIFSLQLSCCDFTFHITKAKRKRKRCEGKCWVRWMWWWWAEVKKKKLSWSKRLKMMIGYEFELVWLDLAVSHVCVCPLLCFCQILGSFISILYRFFFLLFSYFLCVFTEKKLVSFRCLGKTLCVCAMRIFRFVCTIQQTVKLIYHRHIQAKLNTTATQRQSQL